MFDFDQPKLNDQFFVKQKQQQYQKQVMNFHNMVNDKSSNGTSDY